MHNNALWSNSNAFSLIICKIYTKRENVGNWNSGPKKPTLELPILHIPKSTENLWRIVLEYIKKLEQITTRGGPPGGHNPHGRVRQPCSDPIPMDLSLCA